MLPPFIGLQGGGRVDCQHKIAQFDINGQSESLEVLSSELELILALMVNMTGFRSE